jgi:hypothetical protein
MWFCYLLCRMKKICLGVCAVFLVLCAKAQYWQQKIKYVMNVSLNSETHQLQGTQKIDYTNNSPDTLKKIFLHLYWNAFAPGSAMDERSRVLGQTVLANGRQDWDDRVKDRIFNLKPNEIGKQEVKQLKINGVVQKTIMHETILEVVLSKPIAPKQTIKLETVFEAQVPIQIRRSGRDNAEGVQYSMAQWYPKVCEYDKEGWHPTPYIAREFFGVWGDFDVTLNMDSKYCVAATGYIQNPVPKGFNYEGVQVASKNGKHSWRFVAPNVHDFVWAADPDYIHNTKKVRNNLTLHSFYKIDKEKLATQYFKMGERQKANFKNNVDVFIQDYTTKWEGVLDLAAKALPYIDNTFGFYPYNQYSFIQGGDGGMEYPMATLLKGAGRDVVIHEWMHSWYQMMLGTNESLYSWMDEGFTSYAEDRTKHWLDGAIDTVFAHEGSYNGYINLATKNKQYDEPLTTHADQYNTNYAYSTNSYSKGAVFMEQLGYIVGAKTRDRILLNYFNKWKFKHPDVNDLIKLAEQESGLQLDWYKTFFVNTNKTIDYKLDSAWQTGNTTQFKIERLGKMPMPIDVCIEFKDGSKEWHYIPLDLMYGAKPAEDKNKLVVYPAWKWTVPTYTISTNNLLYNIVKVTIDPTRRMADVDKKNNAFQFNWDK